MNYIEISVRIEPLKEEYTEILSAVFAQIGFESFMEINEGFKAYIPQNDFNPDFAQEINQNEFPFSFRYEINSVEEQNWNEIWEKNYFKPIQIGTECVVRASFHTDYQKANHEIVIDPKTAFGTGNHGTTYLLLEEILKHDLEGKSVLDMGCGTGILAILCRMKGASEILAVDNDPRACANARENTAFNNVDQITVAEGTSAILKDEQFDVIFENIWKNTVIADLPVLAKHIKPGGFLTVSGFYVEDVEDVKYEAAKSDFVFQKTESRDNWAIVCFTKK
jgi:ribosomal protein L11 methyltransferase